MSTSGNLKAIKRRPKPLIKVLLTPTKPLLVVLKPARVVGPYKPFYLLATNDFRREHVCNKKPTGALISPFLPYGRLSSFAPTPPSRSSIESLDTNRRSRPLNDARSPGSTVAGISRGDSPLL